MPFKTLGLSAPILRALAEEGYSTPTPIQAQAIPPILEGRDLLGCAQTGTGKTAAFSLPLIHRLHEMAPDKSSRGPVLPRALILSPTRELAAQIGESVATYGRHVGLAHTVIFGGVSQHHQTRALQRGVDVLIATPGRLIDLMQQRLVNLSKVCVFVLDEADRMLDMGFIQPIRTIAASLPAGPGARQTLLFSATMPREIMHLADSLLRNPVKVAVTPVASAAPLIEQRLYHVSTRQKQALLEHLLRDKAISRAVVFTKTKHGADKVCKRLHQDGVDAVAIHGNKAQNYRTRALDAFRAGRVRVLVATDVAARGLDVDNITHVFNFDLPMEPEAYVHRIGRTARAGASGIAISFCDSIERGLLRDIQRLTKAQIPVVPVPENLPEPKPVPHGPMGMAHGSAADPGSHRDGDERDSRDSRRSRPQPRRGGYPNARPNAYPGAAARDGGGPRSPDRFADRSAERSAERSVERGGGRPDARGGPVSAPSTYGTHTPRGNEGDDARDTPRPATRPTARPAARPGPRPRSDGGPRDGGPRDGGPRSTNRPRSDGGPRVGGGAGNGGKPPRAAGNGPRSKAGGPGPASGGDRTSAGDSGQRRSIFARGKPTRRGPK
jgi:ATP-dependent RNA helicase RhlE